jgi:enoyl-CoA hydratase
MPVTPEVPSVLVDAPADGVRLITMHRPERLNALTVELISALTAALAEADADPSVRCVILTGSGRGFCSGADLTGMGDAPDSESLGDIPANFLLQQHIAGLVTTIRRLRKPIVAAVNGPAAGGGLALVLAADVRLAAISARFAASFIKVGVSGADVSTSWLLPRIVGAGNAHLLMLTGRLIDAQTARDMQLVVDVVPDDQLIDAALEVAAEIAANSPFGVWMTKEVMWSALEIPGQQAAIDLENRTQVLAAQLEDARAQRATALTKEPVTYQWR